MRRALGGLLLAGALLLLAPLPARAELSDAERLNMWKLRTLATYMMDGVIIAYDELAQYRNAANDSVWSAMADKLSHETSQPDDVKKAIFRHLVRAALLMASMQSGSTAVSPYCTNCSSTLWNVMLDTDARLKWTVISGSLGTLASLTGCAGQPCLPNQAARDRATVARAKIQCAIDIFPSGGSVASTSCGEMLFSSGINTALTHASAQPTHGVTSDSLAREWEVTSLYGVSEHAPFLYGTSSNIIGPHGDWLAALRILGPGDSSVIRWMEDFLIGIESVWRFPGATPYTAAQNAAFGQGFVAMARLHKHVMHLIAAYALAPTSTSECAMTPEHLVARALASAMSKTDGMPKILRDLVVNNFAAINGAMRTRPTLRHHIFLNGVAPSSITNTDAFEIFGRWAKGTLEAWAYFNGTIQHATESPILSVTQLRFFRKQNTKPFLGWSNTVCADSTAPVVAWSSPAASATLSGLVTLTATCTDNMRVAKVEFSIGGTRLPLALPEGKAAPLDPFTIRWDSTEVANGATTIRATCTDGAGNTHTADRAFTVANS